VAPWPIVDTRYAIVLGPMSDKLCLIRCTMGLERLRLLMLHKEACPASGESRSELWLERGTLKELVASAYLWPETLYIPYRLCGHLRSASGMV